MSREREFMDVLTDLSDGSLHQQLTDALPEVVQAVKATRRAGKLSLTLDIKCENNMVVVNGKISTKIPQAPVDPTMFYADDKGTLTREDPRQIPLRNVLKDAAKPKTVAAPESPAPRTV